MNRIKEFRKKQKNVPKLYSKNHKSKTEYNISMGKRNKNAKRKTSIKIGRNTRNNSRGLAQIENTNHSVNMVN